MKPETAEVYWLDTRESVSFTELAELSGLSEADMQALVEHGLFTPVEWQTTSWTFSAECVTIARTAGRLRHDLGLDIEALTLTMTLLQRIRMLEEEVQRFQARAPRWGR